MSSEFESVTENAALKTAIADAVADAAGALPFRDFMEMALYHPTLGYYTSRRDVIGRSADYLTSSELTPLFGAMLGRQLREMWERLDRPDRFDAVEAGPGTGVLARDVLGWAARTAPDLAAALRYTLVETSPTLAERQQTTLAAEGFEAQWRDDLPSTVSGCIFSNELLDAMPVHRVAVEDGALREVYVTRDGDGFGEELRDPHPDVAAYFGALGLLPGEGCHAEVNLEAPRWIASAAGALDRGYVLTFDYGYEAGDLYAGWRAEGTLLCFYRHNPATDPYARIGRQDITSHVDFTTIRRSGEDAGLTTLGLTTQAEFLGALGIGEALQPPTGERPKMEEYFARRRAVTDLIDPGGLGRVKVLVQAKAAAGPLSGLSDDVS
ncbi:MAG: SAM-dependent methyltransferase [Chloroflexi bacterium]|nr:MAG: SAM-dependent methyltransferase [Chloroflexota bacterium]